MHVLLTEAQSGGADAVATQLREIGCRVTGCHDRGGICRALAPAGHCPLDGREPVDLVVDVRAPMPELTAREFGAVCAIRAGVPVIVVSTDGSRPVVPPGLRRFVVAASHQELLDACADALRLPDREAEVAGLATAGADDPE
jgi:hypothetical protein